tara:strand:- start:545 stop:1483 length:939 start_codon:yes stop_codon:yes gene_type:complete
MILAILFAGVAFSAGFWIALPLLSGRLRWLAPALSIVIAGGAAGVYFIGGQPEMRGVSYAQAADARREADSSTLSPQARVESLRDRVRQDEADSEAWLLLGRELARSGSHLEAIAAFQRALRLDPQARTFSDLGQTLINLNEGTVTDDARRAFEQAQSLDPDLPEAAFFLGLAAYQASDRQAAASQWSSILARLEPDDPFGMVIARQAVDLLSRPNASLEDVEAASDIDMEPQARIGQMISGLEARLVDSPDDLSGWLVLARVKRTLDDRPGSVEALAQAEANFSANPGAMVLVDTARAMLGLNEEIDRETP